MEREKFFFKDWFYPDFSRLCHRTRKCMEISLYHGKIRRCGICADLFILFACFRTSDYGNGIFRGKSKPEKYCNIF